MPDRLQAAAIRALPDDLDLLRLAASDQESRSQLATGATVRTVTDASERELELATLAASSFTANSLGLLTVTAQRYLDFLDAGLIHRDAFVLQRDATGVPIAAAYLYRQSDVARWELRLAWQPALDDDRGAPCRALLSAFVLRCRELAVPVRHVELVDNDDRCPTADELLAVGFHRAPGDDDDLEVWELVP
jgi:hypothetical protein